MDLERTMLDAPRELLLVRFSPGSLSLSLSKILHEIWIHLADDCRSMERLRNEFESVLETACRDWKRVSNPEPDAIYSALKISLTRNSKMSWKQMVIRQLKAEMLLSWAMLHNREARLDEVPKIIRSLAGRVLVSWAAEREIFDAV